MKEYEFSLLVTLYLFGKKLQALAKNHNSDVMSLSIILFLISLKRQSVSDIAEILSIKISAATTKICELEHLGYLRRSASEDRRSHMIDITALGKKQLVKSKQSMVRSDGHATLGITKAEALQIESLVNRIRLG